MLTQTKTMVLLGFMVLIVCEPRDHLRRLELSVANRYSFSWR